ncbi:MAG: ester cyclase [Thermoproteota archaeon]|nr:ester cyclase [Thermoproteota archaeon]
MKYYPMEENKVLIKSFIEEVFNKHNLTAADKYIAAAPGREGFKQMMNRLFLAFPDIHGTVEHILAEDNLVVVYLNWTGNHKGVFQGIPPTDKPITIRSADLYRIENSKIVEHWDVVDYSNLRLPPQA